MIVYDLYIGKNNKKFHVFNRTIGRSTWRRFQKAMADDMHIKPEKLSLIQVWIRDDELYLERVPRSKKTHAAVRVK